LKALSSGPAFYTSKEESFLLAPWPLNVTLNPA
jgi:hypothetical protein